MIITVVGAGGKTTVCNSLGAALAARGKKVLFTTTTHINRPFNINVTVGTPDKIPSEKGFSAAAKLEIQSGKLKGFTGEEIDQLDKTNRFDSLVVEGDGAKGRPVKAPEAWEPVYPQSTSILIGVIGLDCLGRPVSDEFVHRSALFSRITGAQTGDLITQEHLLALIRHPQGLFRFAPKDARKVVFLNKADILKCPEEETHIIIQGADIPVFLTERNTNWTNAFISKYIL